MVNDLDRLRVPGAPSRPGAPAVAAHFPQGPVDGAQIELLRVERPSDPGLYLAVLLVMRVPENLQEVLVAGGATAVLRRACPLAAVADGISDVRLGIDRPTFDLYPVA